MHKTKRIAFGVFSATLTLVLLLHIGCKKENFIIDFDTPYVWVVGDNTLMCSKDAGLTWKNIFEEEYGIDLWADPEPKFRTVYFYNTTFGYITGKNVVTFYFNTENGLEWEGRAVNNQAGSLIKVNVNGFSCPENKVKFYITDTDFYKDCYNGKIKRFWRTKLKSMIFPNEAQGWILGDSTPAYTNTKIPVILTTLDSAKTWTKTTFNSPSIITMATSALPNGFNKWAIGANGLILKSPNLSSVWSQLSSGVTDSLYSIYFQSPDNGYVTGCNGLILRTKNQGLTWEKLVTNTNETITSISFMNDKAGIAVGKNGTVLKTADSGDSWEAFSLGITNNLYGVTFCKRKVFNPEN
jgi:photosystem II stability/assembly factor-like uncharacterized protein